MTKEDILDYIADMAEQLADLSRPVSGAIAACFDLAALLARERQGTD